MQPAADFKAALGNTAEADLVPALKSEVAALDPAVAADKLKLAAVKRNQIAVAYFSIDDEPHLGDLFLHNSWSLGGQYGASLGVFLVTPALQPALEVQLNGGLRMEMFSKVLDIALFPAPCGLQGADILVRHPLAITREGAEKSLVVARMCVRDLVEKVEQTKPALQTK